MPRPSSLLLSLALSFGLTVPTPAQDAARIAPASGQRVLVLFRNHAFSLEAYRQACWSGQPDAVVRPLVEQLERDAVASRQAFVAGVARLGGKVLQHYWIVDGCLVQLPEGQMAAVAELPNVAQVQQEPICHTSIIDATNATHHASDQANTRVPATGGGFVRGNGLAVAIVDTGCDGNMGGTGRPHMMYYTNGVVSPANLRLRLQLDASGYGTEAVQAHGLHTAACAASGGWSGPSADRGIAPESDIISIKTDDPSGGLPGGAILSAYQSIASNRAAYKIVATNCSFSGSPNPTDVLQQGVDSLAYNSNVFVAVAAGNSGTAGTGSSQRGFNCVSAGSIDKNTLAWSSFSSTGPTYLNATFPDIAAVGNAVIVPGLDNEGQSFQTAGTSFSSPFVAGAGLLVLHAGGKNPSGFPLLNALETKAVLLNTTQALSNTNRNFVGLGMLKCTTAVDQATAGLVVHDTVAVGTPKNFSFNLNANEIRSVTIAWFRSDLGNANVDNLDLRIYNPSNVLVASSLTTANSYEKVTFTAAVAGTYRAEVTAVAVYGVAAREFAIAGAAQRAPLVAPQITGISPGSVPVYGAPQVTLTGVGFTTASKVTCAGIDVTAITITGDTQIRFTPPQPTALGPQNVTVTASLGVSNPVTLTYTPVDPALLQGPAFMASNVTYPFSVYAIPNGISFLWISGSNQPSSAPGVVDFGIGANFTNLILLRALGNNGIGFGVLSLPIPPGSAGVRFFMQAMEVDFFNNPNPPYATSNVISCTVVI